MLELADFPQQLNILTTALMIIWTLCTPSPTDLSELQKENSESGHARRLSQKGKENWKERPCAHKHFLEFLDITEARLEVPSVDFNCVELHFYRRHRSAAWGRGRLGVGARPRFKQTSDDDSVRFPYWRTAWDLIIKRSSAKDKLTTKSRKERRKKLRSWARATPCISQTERLSLGVGQGSAPGKYSMSRCSANWSWAV